LALAAACLVTALGLQGAVTSAAAAAPWTGTGPLNVARQDHTATVFSDGSVLAAAGRSRAGAEVAAEIFNPTTNLWTTTGSLAAPRYAHTDTLLEDGQVLAAGGLTGTGRGFDFVSISSAELYDRALGAWRPTGPPLGAP
jgi:hypothetical protein